MIYSVGDSHAISFCDVPNTIVEHCGPMTMHHVGLFGFPGVSKDKLLPGDTVFCSFGEIDVRCHVHEQVLRGRTEEETISTLSNSFIKAVLVLVKHQNINVWIVSVTAPSHKNGSYAVASFPFIGEDADRARYTVILNDKLKQLASDYGLKFLDLYAACCDEHGMLKRELSDGSVHINKTVVKLLLSNLIE